MSKRSRRRSKKRRRDKRRVSTRRRQHPRRPTPGATDPTLAPPASAETLLLALARDISSPDTTRAKALGEIDAIVRTLSGAYAPEAPLAIALREDWLRGRDDKTARLALAWAREQLRLALVEVLQRSRVRRVPHADGDVETVAWLWLAACEALAHEPPSAVGDREHALVAFLRRA